MRDGCKDIDRKCEHRDSAGFGVEVNRLKNEDCVDAATQDKGKQIKKEISNISLEKIEENPETEHPLTQHD